MSKNKRFHYFLRPREPLFILKSAVVVYDVYIQKDEPVRLVD